MKIEKLIAEVLIVEEEELTNEASPDSIDSWDSLGHINIITALEDEFDIEISPEEIGDIKNIGDIKKLLASKNIDTQ